MRFEPSRLTKYNRTTILAEMDRVARRFFDGQAPSHGEFNRHSRVHSQTVVKEFGSWESAWRTVGMEYVRSPVKTKAIVADLKRVLQITGGYFSYRSYRESGGLYSEATIRKRFGNVGWSQVLFTVLGIRSRSPRQVLKKERPKSNSKATSREGESGGIRCTAEQLLADLRLIASKTKKDVLSYHDYRALGGKHCHATFRRVFNTWPIAVHAIGLKSGEYKARHRKPNFTDEEYFQELQRVWEILGRQPKAREMKANGSRMSAQAFQDRFKSWIRAIHAFCEERNSPDSNVDTGSSGVVSESVSAELGQVAKRAMEEPQPANGASGVRKRTPRKPSPRLRWKVFVRDRFTCRVCGRSPANVPGLVLEVDHIVSYSGLGETVLENLQLLCRDCNSGKSDLSPVLPE